MTFTVSDVKSLLPCEWISHPYCVRRMLCQMKPHVRLQMRLGEGKMEEFREARGEMFHAAGPLPPIVLRDCVTAMIF